MATSKEKSFLSNAVMYGVGSLLLQAASIVLLPLYLNYLSPEEYGVLEILNQVGTFVVIGLMANGLRMATLTFYQQTDALADKHAVTSTIIVLVSCAVLCGSLVSLGIAPPLSRWLELSNKQLLAFGMITVLLEALIIVPLALMQARIESVLYVSVSLAMFLVRITLTIYLLSYLELGLWGVLLARSIVAVLFGGLLNWRELKGKAFRMRWNTAREVIAFASPFLPGGLLAFFINSGDRFYLVKFAGEYEVGIYALAYRMAAAVGMLAFIPLYQVWSAKMYAAARGPDAAKVFGSVFTYFLANLTAASLGLILFADDLLMTLGGRLYADSVSLLPLLLIATVFMSMANLMDSGLYVTRKTKYKPFVFFLTAVIVLVAYSWLIPPFGGLGAAWATLIGFSCHVMATFVVTQKVFRVEYQWSRIVLLVASAFGCGTAGLIIAAQDYSIIKSLFIYLLWFTLIYSVATRRERQYVNDLIWRACGRRPHFQADVATSGACEE